MQKVLCRLRWLTSAPNVPGLGQADEGVEVGAVDVDLPAGVVHGAAQLDDVVLEHAVGRRVGDHERGEPVGVLGELGCEVVEVDVAGLGAGDHDHAHAGHGRRRRVGAVGRRRDEADVAVGRRRWLRCHARMASRPASSPWLPALGCSDTAS